MARNRARRATLVCAWRCSGIPWSVLGDAVGAEEQLELRRSARVRELYEEEFESEEEEFDEDEDDYVMDEPY